MAGIAAAAAVEHAECCICFDALCDEPVAVLLKQNVRVCPHYFHYDCIKDMCPYITRGYGMEMEIETGGDAPLKCPMCRALFQAVVKMPDPFSDPETWFVYADYDRTGQLTFNNVRDVVNAILSIDQRELEKLLHDNWAQWDSSRSGGITRQELPRLLAFVRDTRRGIRPRPAEVPHITSREAWYDYWDADRNGALDKAEVARALVKTFEKGTMSQQKIRDVVSALASVWGVFDVTGSGTITRQEFMARDGLADAIVAVLVHDPTYAAAVQMQEGQREAPPPAVNHSRSAMNAPQGHPQGDQMQTYSPPPPQPSAPPMPVQTHQPSARTSAAQAGQGLHITNEDIHNRTIEDASLRNCALYNCVLTRCTLVKVDLYGTCRLTHCQTREADFKRGCDVTLHLCMTKNTDTYGTVTAEGGVFKCSTVKPGGRLVPRHARVEDVDGL